MSSCISECCAACCKAIFLCIWPVLSVILGLIFGSILGVCITLVVFFFTLIRTPMHIFKMLYVTATTKECFKGYFAFNMRVAVLFLVPAVHILFLVGITVFSGTVGMLYYIGKTTAVFYKHEYKKTLNKLESNAKLEPKSYLGKYYKACRKYMTEDQRSHSTIYFLKGMVAIIPGVVFGILPLIPFAICILAITLWRLPINVYKTMKIALSTVLLKWDLRLVALMTLPLVHLLFPLVTFIGSMFFAFFVFINQTTSNFFDGESPFHKWDDFYEFLDEYHRTHKDFVSERCALFDHPSGIPYNWDGDSYGIPVRRILLWQWDFLVCCFFTLFAAPVCFIGSLIMAIIKYIPSCFNAWYEVTKEYCNQTCVAIMGAWPFYIAGMVLLPAGVLLVYVLFIVIGTLMAFRAPYEYLEHGYLAAWYEPLSIIRDLDHFSRHICFEWEMFQCGENSNPYRDSVARRRHVESTTESRTRAELYWDRFMTQCIKTTSELLDAKWLLLDSVQGIDPSVVESIPAIAILTVLADTANESKPKEQEIKWTIDGTTCKKQDIPLQDGVTAQLWPKVVEIKKLLLANKKLVLKEENIQLLKAMMCSNTDDDTETLKGFLKVASSSTDTAESKKVMAKNTIIRTKINALVLAMLRVRPYRDRMEKIYTHDYEGSTDPNYVIDDMEAGKLKDNDKNNKDGSGGKENENTNDGNGDIENQYTEEIGDFARWSEAEVSESGADAGEV